jgi:type II secretory pathway component PulJ
MLKSLKQSFTLVEMLISISLFSIIIIFLYDTLDLNQKTNKFFLDKLNESQVEIKLKKILFSDILNANKASIKVFEQKNKNFILTMQSKNIYHDKFYPYITYIVSKKNRLLRIEHQKKYQNDKMNFNDDKLFIDILEENIKLFQVIKSKNNITFILQKKDEKTIYLLIKL